MRFSDMGFAGYGIELLPVTPADLPSLRRWRNSPEISRLMLDSSYISPRQQRLWFEKIRGRTDRADWVVWRDGVRTGCVNIHGNGSLTGQPWLSGGYYIVDSPVRHALLGYAAVLMYHDIIFGHAFAPEVRDVVLKTNFTARRMNLQFGYREESGEGDKILISLKAADYRKAREKISKRFEDPQCRAIAGFDAR